VEAPGVGGLVRVGPIGVVPQAFLERLALVRSRLVERVRDQRHP
jgi:hypothetical protein